MDGGVQNDDNELLQVIDDYLKPLWDVNNNPKADDFFDILEEENKLMIGDYTLTLSVVEDFIIKQVDDYLQPLWVQYFYPQNVKAFYDALKNENRLKLKNYRITQSMLNDFLKKQETRQEVAQPPAKPKKFNSIISFKVRNNYQMDLMDYDRHTFNGYKYILVVIDVYSRYVMCKALRTREQANNGELTRAVKEIFEKMGPPVNLNCDNEFKSNDLINYFESKNINVWYSDSTAGDITSKNAIVERFNKTLSIDIANYRRNAGRNNWTQVLDKIVDAYNNRKHLTIKETPQKIWDGDKINRQTIVQRLDEPKFKVGDKVRIRLPQQKFTKADRATYSTNIYTIKRPYLAELSKELYVSKPDNKKPLKSKEFKTRKWVLVDDEDGLELQNPKAESELKLVSKNTKRRTESQKEAMNSASRQVREDRAQDLVNRELGIDANFERPREGEKRKRKPNPKYDN